MNNLSQVDEQLQVVFAVRRHMVASCVGYVTSMHWRISGDPVMLYAPKIFFKIFL